MIVHTKIQFYSHHTQKNIYYAYTLASYAHQAHTYTYTHCAFTKQMRAAEDQEHTQRIEHMRNITITQPIDDNMKRFFRSHVL